MLPVRRLSNGIIPVVRDLDVARRAQVRGFITAEQLREAREFAAGGRSILAVLLDLGHLKPDDLLTLGDAPEKPRPGRPFWIATLGAILFACAAFTFTGLAPSAPAPVSPPPVMIAPSTFADQASEHARRRLAGVERALDARGRPTADGDRELRQAAALLEEAAADGPRIDDVLALARIHELLDEWELARELYRRALAERPSSLGALLGASRTSLLLRDLVPARAYADRACAEPPAPAEALFLRGSAAFAQGDGAAATADLAAASRLDASFLPRAEALMTGRSAAR
jgi:tetratricopeptide (TPR) repeat protein